MYIETNAVAFSSNPLEGPAAVGQWCSALPSFVSDYVKHAKVTSFRTVCRKIHENSRSLFFKKKKENHRRAFSAALSASKVINVTRK